MAPPVRGTAAPLFAYPGPARRGVMTPDPDAAATMDHAHALRALLWWVAAGLVVAELVFLSVSR